MSPATSQELRKLETGRPLLSGSGGFQGVPVLLGIPPHLFRPAFCLRGLTQNEALELSPNKVSIACIKESRL